MNEPKMTTASYPLKKRYEWIDNSRVIAAFLIMYVHLPYERCADLETSFLVHDIAVYSTHAGRVALFLMLSGYLFGRNASWAKTWDRFIWLLIPYVLWNMIIWGCRACVSSAAQDAGIWQILGFGAIFNERLVFTPAGPCSPLFDGPSWYMRDMLPLTLLTPLIVRFKKYIPMALILFILGYDGSYRMNPDVMLSPGTMVFYCVGIWLTNFKIEDAYRIFNERFTIFAVLIFVLGAMLPVFRHFVCAEYHFAPNLLGMMLGAMTIAHCGVLIENHLPKLSKRLAPLGPASFLVFMLHVPTFYAFVRLCPQWAHSLWLLLMPIPAFVLIVTTFLCMKKYTPWLMPYLGHMKIRKQQ